MMSTKISLAAFLVAICGAVEGYSASIIGLVVEGGGTAQVYQLNNGNFLGLWGFDNREGANPGAGAVNIGSAADISMGFTPSSASSIVAYYNGTNPINVGASEFEVLSFPFTVADNARLFDSLWVEWTGGNLVYNTVTGGTATMGTTVTRSGDPLIPEPSALGLMACALGFGLRRRAR